MVAVWFCGRQGGAVGIYWGLMPDRGWGSGIGDWKAAILSPNPCPQIPILARLRGVTFTMMQRRLVWVQLGLIVGLSAVGLGLGVPQRLASGGGLFVEWGRVAAFLIGFVVVMVPFDYLGGFWIWRKFAHFDKLRTGRIPPQTPSTYLRALLLHTVIYLLIAFALLLAGQANCLTAVLAVVIAISFAQIEWQDVAARQIGNIQRVERNLGAEDRLLKRQNLAIGNVRVLAASDPAFGGGYTGRPGHAVLILPARWLDEAGSPYAARQMIRRAAVLHDGGRNRGLLLALMVNVVGLALTAFVPGAGFATAAELITTVLAFTLWSALWQVSVLPWTSRRAVLAADYFVAKKGVPKRMLGQTFAMSEMASSAEYAYPYPIPCKQERLDQLAQHERPRGAWQAQHMTLYLSWGCLGLLSRGMWGIGRPQLWVMGVGD